MIITLLRQAGHRAGGGAVLAHSLGIASAPPNVHRVTRRKRLVINWGVSSIPQWRSNGVWYSNSPQAVANCANKLECFNLLINNKVPCVGATWPGARYLDGTKAPEWDEKVWLEEDGKIVVRHILTGHSGAGIQIVRRGEDIPDAPLYTRYFRKSAEYRVHVAFGKVILIQQKRKENNFEADGPNHNLVRTRTNGWVFCVTGLDCDSFAYRSVIEELAISAIRAVGANHGAVDLLVRHKDASNTKELDQAVVCEINSAPAIRADSTLEAYSASFKEWITTFRNGLRGIGPLET